MMSGKESKFEIVKAKVEASKHKTLDEFDDAKVTITGPDGESTQTTIGKLNEISEAVQQDPSLIDRALRGDQ